MKEVDFDQMCLLGVSEPAGRLAALLMIVESVKDCKVERRRRKELSQDKKNERSDKEGEPNKESTSRSACRVGRRRWTEAGGVEGLLRISRVRTPSGLFLL